MLANRRWLYDVELATVDEFLEALTRQQKRYPDRSWRHYEEIKRKLELQRKWAS